MLKPQCVNGFTLVECMVACSVFAVLCVMALPNFTSALRDAQVRTAGQSLISGLQLARAESIRRNAPVQLVMNNELGGAATAGGTDWMILADDQKTPGTPNYTVVVQKRSGLEGSPKARMGARTVNDFTAAAAPGQNLPGAITFSSLGRLAVPPVSAGTAGAAILQIDIVHAQSADARRLSVSVTPGGQIRLCDPVMAVAVNAQGCA